jgi:hypothetical protein
MCNLRQRWRQTAQRLLLWQQEGAACAWTPAAVALTSADVSKSCAERTAAVVPEEVLLQKPCGCRSRGTLQSQQAT